MTDHFAFYRLKARLRNSVLNINYAASLGFLATALTVGADGQGTDPAQYVYMGVGLVFVSALARFVLLRNSVREAKQAIRS
jgi:surface polysaccharide O-acyltransferase-like enzyme